MLRLTHLIENLLSSGRLIDGGAELYFEPTELDLATLLREVCQLHREMVPAAEIVENFGDAPMPIVGDGKLLFQVFSDLLANAVKYSPNGGTILVEAAVIANKAGVSVTGPPTWDSLRRSQPAVRALLSRRQCFRRGWTRLQLQQPSVPRRSVSTTEGSSTLNHFH